MTGSEALLRALKAMGVECIFASPGSDWAPLWETLAAPNAAADFPAYVSSRHEDTALKRRGHDDDARQLQENAAIR